jgi:hypothetical protein
MVHKTLSYKIDAHKMFVKFAPVGAEHEHEEQNTCPDYFSEDALILKEDVDQTLKKEKGLSND